MVNYRGPPKKWGIKEAEELRTKPHAYTMDLEGNHIIEELPGVNYKPIPIPPNTIETEESPKSTTMLMEEAKKLLQKETRTATATVTPKPQTEQEKELENEKKKWDRYYFEHPNERHKPLPKTFLDEFTVNENSNQNVNTNEVRKLRKLINDK